MDVKMEIMEFISSSNNNGALLITGDWGCGKSFLIKEIADELQMQGKCELAVVSLFGVDSVAMIHEKVKDIYLERLSGLLGGKARQVYRTLAKALIEAGKVTSAALPGDIATSAVATGISSATSLNPINFLAVKKTIGRKEKARPFAIVFDDFERCSIMKKKLLGVINEYSENKQIKTIVIMDEDKIQDPKYREFKEKLVLRTLKLTPDHSEIIHQLLENYQDQDESYRQFLLDYETCIRSTFLNSKYGNLRSLKACLNDFRRVYFAWKNSGIPMDDIENVLYQFCAIEYESRAGNLAKYRYGYRLFPKGETEDQRKAREREIEGKYALNAFSSENTGLAQWIVDGDWNEEEFIRYIRKKYATEEMTHEERFLHSIFWDLQQKDIDIGMPYWLDRAYSGNATGDELIALLQRVHRLDSYKFTGLCHVDYEKLEAGWEMRKQGIRNGTIQEPRQRTFSELDQINLKAESLYKSIEKVEELKTAWGTRLTFISFLKQEENISKYLFKDRPIDRFDDELYHLFLESYRKAQNSGKHDLFFALNDIDFDRDTYSTTEDKNETLKNFQKLSAEFEAIAKNEKDQMSALLSKHAIEMLEKKITKLKNMKT